MFKFGGSQLDKKGIGSFMGLTGDQRGIPYLLEIYLGTIPLNSPKMLTKQLTDPMIACAPNGET